MKVEYINPFIEASQTVFKQIASMEAKLGKVYLKTSPYRSEDIVIMVGLTGKIRGQASFSMRKEFGMRLASNMMMGMPVTELDDMSKSAIAELANMIMGNAAMLLYNKGIQIDITPPTLVMGENLQITKGRMTTICIPLLVGDDTVELDISTEED